MNDLERCLARIEFLVKELRKEGERLEVLCVDRVDWSALIAAWTAEQS